MIKISDVNSFDTPEIDVDELEKSSLEDESKLNAEIEAIKQDYLERYGEPKPKEI